MKIKGYAGKGENLSLPPHTNSQSWVFHDVGADDSWSEPSVSCSVLAAPVHCKVTVSLRGQAKQVQGECEGLYEDTGMSSKGRQVACSKKFESSHFQAQPL